MQPQPELENKVLQTLHMEQNQSLEILKILSLELERYLQEKGNENLEFI